MREKAVAILLATTFMISVSACGNATETADIPASETVESTGTAEAMEEPTEAIEVGELPEAMEATEIAEKLTFTVTAMSATKYTKSNVNVRMGPSSAYERIGGLSINQRVTVTGQADTGWYRIEFNGREAYVSNKYLVDEKVAVTTGTSSSGKKSDASTSDTGASATAQTQNTSGSNATTSGMSTSIPSNAPSNTTAPSNIGSTDSSSSSVPVDANTSDTGGSGLTDAKDWLPGNNSGTTITGEDAQWAIDNGILENGGVLNEDGSVTMP